MNRQEQDLIRSIHRHFEDADGAGESYRIAAGHDLLKLRELIENDGEQWTRFCRLHIRRSLGDIRKVMALAQAEDSAKAAEKERSKRREGMKKSRKNNNQERAHVGAQPPTPVNPIAAYNAATGCPDCDDEENFWQQALYTAASESIATTSFETWSHRYGHWGDFDVPSDLLTLAEQAAEGWKQAASKLRSMRENAKTIKATK